MDGQVKRNVRSCCKCFWNDGCCIGCRGSYTYCSNFTPYLEEDIEYVLESEYEECLDERVEVYSELLEEMECEDW